MQHYKTLSTLHRELGWPPPEDPLVSMLSCENFCALKAHEFTTDCYIISFKKLKAGVILYGRTTYDHTNGTMMFVKPRQILQMKNIELEESGFMILIHEDYLYGHDLHRHIDKYSFFDYEINEALHLSPIEEDIIQSLYQKITREYYNNTDEYSKEIIISHIESMLTYAKRFFKRQFINRKQLSGTTITRFHEVLKAYLSSELPKEKGLPTVQHMASMLHISPRYLSDMLKQETGKTALELIHMELISRAKHLLLTHPYNISEIAFMLGFDNSSYFTKVFKKQVGLKPTEFKKRTLGQA